MDIHSCLNSLSKKSSLFLSEDTCLARSDAADSSCTSEEPVFSKAAPKRANDQLGCALCAIHITTTFLDASCNDFGTFSFLERELMFVITDHKPGCKLGFLAVEAMVSNWFFLKSHLLLQWNSCEPFNGGSVCQRAWKSHSSSLLAQFHKTTYWS